MDISPIDITTADISLVGYLVGIGVFRPWSLNYLQYFFGYNTHTMEQVSSREKALDSG